ncbi:hypothetical protein BT67DRAFT_489338 [Trichocladium antarcticum]|uniref:Uncharacterized protein n=1 Tax=Trichocladium antarcticum TaxID=1450529 RepID=A0AAN6UDZ9_9PEZI|nr:hypothetical protein BT67DRAFT_489338 [Trichocladium antarcticum]
MYYELVTARRDNFDSLPAFQTRINYLKERLKTLDFKMTDKAYTWLALKGNEGPAFVTIPKKNDETLVKCKDCTLMIKTSQRHCKDCGSPLHQQSGVKTPSTTTKKAFVAIGDPKKILFTSGMNANPSLFTTQMEEQFDDGRWIMDDG